MVVVSIVELDTCKAPSLGNIQRMSDASPSSTPARVFHTRIVEEEALPLSVLFSLQVLRLFKALRQDLE